jgi:hypothetical protein
VSKKRLHRKAKTAKSHSKFIAIAVSIILVVLSVAVVAYLESEKPIAAFQAASPAIVSVEPNSTELQNAQIGQTVDVDINVTNVRNLWGWELDNLTFNPKVLNLTQVLEGPFLKTGGSTFFVTTLSATNWVKLGVVPSTNEAIYSNSTVNGGGAILTLQFTILSAGVSPIIINGPNNVAGTSAITLYNNHEYEYQPNTTTGNNQSINCTVTNGEITIDKIVS